MTKKKEHNHSREPFWRYFLCWPPPGSSRGVPLVFRRREIAPVLIVALASAVGLGNFEVLHLMEIWAIDFQLALSKPHDSRDIYIVKITDYDYAHLFESKSPLDPTKVRKLVNDTATLQPSIIGVDLDTTDPAWSKACDSTGANPCVQFPKPPSIAENIREDTDCPRHNSASKTVFWAAIPEVSTNERTYTWENNKPLIVSPPIGGTLQNLKCASGLPGFPQDSDGKVRRYDAQFTARVRDTEKDRFEILNSFARGIAEQYCPSVGETSKDQRFFNFNSPSDFPSISARDLETCVSEHQPCRFKLNGKDSRNSPQGRIILIGGQFHAARDAYETPRGPTTGVELNAMAIDSDLRHKGFGEPPRLTRFGFDVAVGILLTLSYWWLEQTGHYSLAFWVGTVVASMMALIFSYLLFHLFAFCVPVLVGINLHQLSEHRRLAATQ
jgi:CHASE2 domain-containing sensor protein